MTKRTNKITKNGKFSRKSAENGIFRSELHDLDDVKTFFHDLVFVLHVSFHPDEDFKEYINLETKERSFTDLEAFALNKCMELCFKICSRRSNDLIYQLALEATEEFYNHNQQNQQV